MAKESVKPDVDEVQKILMAKASAGNITEAEWGTIRAAIAEITRTQFKERLDSFARRMIGPWLTMRKTVKSEKIKDLLLKAMGPEESQRRSRRASLPAFAAAAPGKIPPYLSPQGFPFPPGHTDYPWPPYPGYTRAIINEWVQDIVPPYSYAGPNPEEDLQADINFLQSDPWHYNAAAKIAWGTTDGKIRIGAAIGPDVGAAQGHDRWIFGDANIAHGFIQHLVKLPYMEQCRYG